MTDETKIITEEQAQACLKIIADYIKWDGGPGWEPALYPPGHEGPFWCVSLEGIGDWAIRIKNNETITWPDGVWVEPVNDVSLALHPRN